jgi:hypothetical protein
MHGYIRVSLVSCLGLGMLQALAQQPAALEGGTKLFGSYAGSNTESVNSENGKLVLNVPLYSAPQRGQLAVSFSLRYQNAGYERIQLCNPPTSGCGYQVEPIPGSSPNGVTAAFDQGYYVNVTNTAKNISGASITAYNAYDVDGTDKSVHNLGYAGSSYRAVDGSGFLFTPAAASTPPWEAGPSDFTTTVPGTLTDQNGTRYTLSPVSGSTAGQLTAITDADGNYLSIANPGLGQVITDSLGRSIPAPPVVRTTSSVSGCPVINALYQTLEGSATWSVPGYGGTQKYLFCFATVPISTGADDPEAKITQYHATGEFIQSIVLPDGTWWGFIYDAANPNNTSSIGYGDLVQLIYPTSGTVTYSWGFNQANPWFCELTGAPLPGPRAIMSRTVNSNAVSGQWTYAFTIVNEGTTGEPVTTITDPVGDQIAYTFQSFSSTQCNLYEVQRVYSQKTPAGTLTTLETVSTQYQTVLNYDGRATP